MTVLRKKIIRPRIYMLSLGLHSCMHIIRVLPNVVGPLMQGNEGNNGS